MTAPVVHHGDCIEVMRGMADNTIDAIVTDPPYGLGFMGKAWDDLPPGIEWAAECLRILKPGGHLLAFGGTRTWHRLACAVEDAGFEIRDSIAWLYGSGFPKSLDVSKAIDKARDDRDHIVAVTTFMAEGAERVGITRADVDAHMGTSDMGGWWLSRLRHRCQTPKWDQWLRLKDLLHLSDAMDAEVWRLNGRKGTPGEDWHKRETIGAGFRIDRHTGAVPYGSGTETGHYDITAPATDAARQWQGWGTALKPAFEPVVMARKPLTTTGLNVLRMVESELRNHGAEGEIHWTPEPVVTAEKSSRTPISYDQTRTPANLVDESGTQSSESASVKSSATSTRHGAKATGNTSGNTPGQGTGNSGPKSSRPTADAAHAAPRPSETSSPLTTSKAAGPLTVGPSTERSTQNFGGRDSRPSTASFAGIATGLTGSRAHVHIARTPDGLYIWPEGLPKYVPGGPLTVAANVLAHGTGALNIDATRIATTDNLNGGAYAEVGGRSESASLHAGSGMNVPGKTTGKEYVAPAGRWPANVALDEDQAAALDQMSGTSKDGVAVRRNRQAVDANKNGIYGSHVRDAEPDMGFGGQGGASRFMYIAKAPKSERPVVDGIAHPTVKPLSLMRWLIRLVTPPGGTVLDPFAGSGTTIEAAMLEGFTVIGIEREADYLPLIQARIDRNTYEQPDDRYGMTPALFDDDGEATA